LTDENVGVSVEDRSDVAEQPPDEAQNAGLPASASAEPNHLLLLATFAHLPRDLGNTARPLSLARRGFFYTGRRRVRCFYCGVDVPLVMGGHESSTLDHHRTLSPGCLMTGRAHPESDTAARCFLFWAMRGVLVRRRQDASRHSDLNINWR